jgi:putative cell wall-binding protein
MTDGIVDVMAWKAAAYGIDPRTTTTLVATSGSNKYAEGKAVSMRTVSGHRDGYLTECPGNALYPLLPSIRAAIATRMAPGLVSPQTSADLSNAGGAAIGFTAVFPTVQRWWLSMTPMCATGSVQVLSGRTAGRVNATWNLDDASGAKVAPGVYRMTMVTSSPVGTAPTWTRDVELLPTPGGPAATCPVARLGTGDLVAGSVIAGRAAYPDAHSVVIVGSGGRLDALVAAPLSRAKGAPLLLSGASALPAAVVADIQARGVQTAWIVGSTASVGPGVESQLTSLGVSTVTRLSGPDRYAMAAAVARQVGAAGSSAVVVSGDSRRVWDAVAAAGPAAAMGRPLLLVTSAGVPPVTAAALKSLAVTNVLVVASAQAVPNTVVAKLGLSGVKSRARVSGADRYATAVAVANAFSRPVPADRVVVAPGTDAGLGWAAIAGSQGRLTVLTDPGAVPPVTSGWLSARKPGTIALVSDLRNGSTALLRQLYTITR